MLRDNSLATTNTNQSNAVMDGKLDGAQSNFDTVQTDRSQSIQQTGTTSFVEDAPVRTATMPMTQTINQMLGTKSATESALSAFLAKPNPIDNFDWTTTEVAGHNYHSSLIGTQLLGNPLWFDKLSGFRYCRGTAVVRLVLNAQPFQQGRLIVHFLPLTTSSSYLTARNVNLMSTTQQPNVEIDCRDGVGEIEIPYISPTQWYDVKTATVDWGTIRVTVLSPLETGSGGSTTVDCTLWLYFKDFEFAGPWFPQSKKFGKSIGESEKQGSISSTLSKVAQASTTIADVPILSSIAKPVAWVSSLASDVASIFGWSKPNIDTTASAVVMRPFRNMANSNGGTQAEALALYSDPSIGILPGFAGTNEDEMSFDFIKSREVFVRSHTWTTTDTSSHLLAEYNVGPGHLYRDGTTITGSYTSSWRTYPPFAYVSQCFNQWRGGINIHLKIIKTDYHSGRIICTFQPGPSLAAPPTVSDSDYVLREIVDIRETSEIVFKLPYMLPAPYAQTEESSGFFAINVLNELRAPPTASTNVKILVYVSAAEDYEVALPRQTNIQPFFPQSKLNSETLNISKWIGNATENGNIDQAQYAVGEKFCSIKQLLSRYSRVFSPDADFGGVYNVIWPWFIGVTSGANAATATSGPMYADTFSRFASGYAMSRGSMRWQIVSQGPTGSTIQQISPVYCSIGVDSTRTDLIANGTVTSDTSLTQTNASPPLSAVTTAAITAFPRCDNGIEVVVPMYNQTPSRINYLEWLTTSTRSATSWTPPTFLQWQFDSVATSGTGGIKRFFRSFGEDGQLGYFVGFLPLLNTHALTPP